MKAGIVTALVTGGFALIYLFLTKMKKKNLKGKRSSNEVTNVEDDRGNKTPSLVNLDNEITKETCDKNIDNISLTDEPSQLITEVPKFNSEVITDENKVSGSSEENLNNSDEQIVDGIQSSVSSLKVLSLNVCQGLDSQNSNMQVNEECKDSKSDSFDSIQTKATITNEATNSKSSNENLDNAETECQLETSNKEPSPPSTISEPNETKISPQKQSQECEIQSSSCSTPQERSPKSDEVLSSPDKPTGKTRRYKKRERKKARENDESLKSSPKKDVVKGKVTTDKSSSKESSTTNNIPFPSADGDINSTSDWEREASPEQENLMSDSQSLISQASLDSGQGSIEVEPETVFSSLAFPSRSSDQYIFYEFEIPQTLVGRLIGRKGCGINKIKSEANVSIVVLDHKNIKLKLCSIEGYKSQVAEALKMIRRQFPLKQFHELTLEQVNTPTPSPIHQPTMDRQFLQVELPSGVINETQAGCVCSAGEIWLQQPLHPSFAALQKLHQCINLNYADGSTTPHLPNPIPPETVCVCFINSQWLRCLILESSEDSCLVNLVDIGGTMNVPISCLRQIRVDYMNLPFQATQCFLYGLQPPTANGWEEMGRLALQELVKDSILFASIAAYSEDNLPYVNLYKREFNEYVYINKRLVEQGHANWLVTEVSP